MKSESLLIECLSLINLASENGNKVFFFPALMPALSSCLNHPARYSGLRYQVRIRSLEIF